MCHTLQFICKYVVFKKQRSEKEMGYHYALYKHITHYYIGPNQKMEISYRSSKGTVIYFNEDINLNPLLKIKYPGKCKIRVGSRSIGVNRDSHRQTETYKYCTFSNYDSLSLVSLFQSFSTSPGSQKWPVFKMTSNNSNFLVFTLFCSLLSHWIALTCVNNRKLQKWLFLRVIKYKVSSSLFSLLDY